MEEEYTQFAIIIILLIIIIIQLSVVNLSITLQTVLEELSMLLIQTVRHNYRSFINNAANSYGGAVYVDGTNNSVIV